MNISLEAKIATGFVVAVLFVFFTSAMSWSNARRFEDTFRWVDHTHEVLTKLEEVTTDILSLQTGSRGFALTGLDRFLEAYERGRSEIRQDLEKLRQLIADNPAQARRLGQLEPLVRQAMAILQANLDTRRTRGLVAVAAVVAAGEGKKAVDAVLQLLLKMEKEERRLLLERSAEAQSAARTTITFLFGGSLATIVIVVAAGAIARREIRELVAAEEKISRQNAQLEAANQELEAFSYSVSHDLRAPLRHIDGFAGLLGKHAAEKLDDKGRRYVATISGAAKQMGRLIDDLLAFSRLGRAELRRTQIDHDALVAGVIRDGRYGANGAGPEWRVAPLPAVHADPALLRQVWANLIDNAVKYSAQAAPPRIEIGSLTKEGKKAEGGMQKAECPEGTASAAALPHSTFCIPPSAFKDVVFFIRDNGAGFDMAYAGKLFGVFSRLHAAAEFEGTGIGLANVRRIVTRHGGRTWAEGKVGEGATFFFSLPREEKAEGRRQNAETESEKPI